MSTISILLGFIQFILICYILCKEVEKNSPVSFLWATLFVIFAFPHLVTVFTHDLPYSDLVISEASLFVILFCLLYIVFRNRKRCDFIYLYKEKLVIKSERIKGSIAETIAMVLFVSSMMYTLLSIVRTNGGVMNTSWWTVREVETGYLSIQTLAKHIIFTFSGLSLYYLLTNRRIKSTLVILLFVLLVVVTRNRVQIIPVLTFFITIYIIKISKIQLKHIVLAIICAILAVYILYAIRAIRWLGTLSDAIDRVSWDYINGTVMRLLSERDGELGLRQYFYFFIENNNQFEGFNRGYTLIRMLMVYIPSRFSLGFKPQSFDLVMGQAIGMVSGGSMHPTLFGDVFGNFYWLGVLGGGFWAAFANVVDRVISRQSSAFYKIMVFFLASYSYVVIGRGSVYNGFEVLAWGVLLLVITKPFFLKLKNIHFISGRIKISLGNRRNNEE